MNDLCEFYDNLMRKSMLDFTKWLSYHETSN
nr:MAG TPA: hypothetical protein [Caudoviricetes sp.]